MTTRIVVVSGGLSEESSTHRLAEGLSKAVRERAVAAGLEDVVVERFDIRDMAQEIASASLTGFASGKLAEAYDALGQADGVIAVTPTYKASYTGLFKAFWDATSDGLLSGVPVIIGVTGGSARHSLVMDFAMRPLFAYLRALVMPTGVFAAPEDWAESGLSARMGLAAQELVAQLGGRRPGGVPSGDSGTFGGSGGEESSSRSASSGLARRREQARDPFVNVPTMSEMLSR